MQLASSFMAVTRNVHFGTDIIINVSTETWLCIQNYKHVGNTELNQLSQYSD